MMQIKITHMLNYKQNEEQITRTRFCCLVCGVLAPRQLLPSPRETITDSIPRYLLVSLVKFSCATATKSLEEAVADPTWIQSTIATRHGMC